MEGVIELNVGYQLEVDNRIKRLGQLIVVPPDTLPRLANSIVLYTRVPRFLALLHNIRHVAIDAEVWEDARERGAQALVKYVFDTRQHIIVLANRIENARTAPAEGGRRQHLIHLDDCITVSKQKELMMPEPVYWIRFKRNEPKKAQGLDMSGFLEKLIDV